MDIQAFRTIHDAVTNGHWWPAATAALILLVSILRKLAAKHAGKLGMWFATDHGAMLLTALGAIAGGMGTALLGGVKPTAQTFETAALAGAIAIAGFPSVRKFIQSWVGFDLGLDKLLEKIAHNKGLAVSTAENGKQKVGSYLSTPELIALKTPVAVESSKNEPPKSAEGGFIVIPPASKISDRTLWIVAVLAALGVFAAALPGCSLSWPDIVRVSATSLNRAVTTGAEIAEVAVDSCGDDAKKLADQQKFVEAHDKKNSCEVLRTDLGVGLATAKSAATGALLSAEAGEKLGKAKPDYAGMLAPVLQAGSSLVKIFNAAKVKGLPPIEGVN